MFFTESNLKNPERSNKVCRETKRMNRSINLIGLIESKNDDAEGLRRKDSPCVRFAQIKPRPRCGIRASHPCQCSSEQKRLSQDVMFYIKSPLS